MYLLYSNLLVMSVKTISSTHAQKSFDDLLMEVNREPVAIQKHGKEVAVLISSYDFHRIIDQANEKKSEKKLSDFIGKGKNNHRFSSTKDVDNFIDSNRETWEI